MRAGYCRVFAAVSMLLSIGGCAGGTRGTGMAVSQMVQRPQDVLSDVNKRTPSRSNLPDLFTRHSCVVARGIQESVISLLTDFGPAQAWKEQSGICKFAVSAQTEKLRLDLSRVATDGTAVRYRGIRVGCAASTVLGGTKPGAGPVVDGALDLPSLQLKEGERLELSLEMTGGEFKIAIVREGDSQCVGK